jgi:hypothetical protein
MKDKLYDNYDDYRKEIAPLEMADIDDESRFLFGIGAAVTYKTFQSGVWAMSDFTYSRTSRETARWATCRVVCVTMCVRPFIFVGRYKDTFCIRGLLLDVEKLEKEGLTTSKLQDMSAEVGIIVGVRDVLVKT